MRIIEEVGRIAFRHVFLPINAIIFSVVVLLITFGNANEGLFLGAIVFVNIALGFGQDLRAWIMLERLQVATAPRTLRVNADGTTESVPLDAIRRGDLLQLKLGDQVPCDGELVSGTSLEVNEGLITGESNSFPRSPGESLLAGSVITSGTGVVRANTPFSESIIAKMTVGLKRYSANPSPIQLSIQRVITYTVYVLVVMIALVVARGYFMHQPELRVIESIGALASVLVPQGLVVSVTLLFTFGAAHFYNRNVLLQEVNATEKFGHIKNLCMDKTGTLTENTLTVESMSIPSGDESRARELVAAYLEHSGDSSQLMRAIDSYIGEKRGGSARHALAFSSWRRYGGICIDWEGSADECILAGAPEAFLDHLSPLEKERLQQFLAEHTSAGKHVMAFVRTESVNGTVPSSLEASHATLLALFVLVNKLRPGIQDSVNFFQDRGITIRILSGDNAETVRAIASAAGVHGTDAAITGAEMEHWSVADYAQKARDYVIFARIRPEQKEKIIEALKQDGFTAMVGDGANDALALKKADLGIAMLDGSQAARQIAAVVLMHNSFTELPGGVRLADSMIENIEIFASIFLNQTFLSFLLYCTLTLAGFDFPLTPLNISLINYFAVGMPGMLISWWAIMPEARPKPVSKAPFFSRVIPMPLMLSFFELVASAFVYYYALVSGANPTSLLVILFVVMGFLYFTLTPRTHTGEITRAQRIQLLVMGVVDALFLYAAFAIPLVAVFFNVTKPRSTDAFIASLTGIVVGIVMVFIARVISTGQKRHS